MPPPLAPSHFARATGILVRVFRELRTLLPAVVQFVPSFKGVSASAAALPTFMRHALVLSYAVRRGLRCGGIIGDAYASASVVDQLLALFRLLDVLLVVHAGDSANVIDGLAVIGCAIAQKK